MFIRYAPLRQRHLAFGQPSPDFPLFLLNLYLPVGSTKKGPTILVGGKILGHSHFGGAGFSQTAKLAEKRLRKKNSTLTINFSTIIYHSKILRVPLESP
jgi:hypothetical protein